MSNGIRSLPRYQEGGDVPWQPHRFGWDWQKRALERIHLMRERYGPSYEPGPIARRNAGLRSLPVPQGEPSWMRSLGLPEHGGVPSLSSEELVRLTPQQQVDYVLLQEFDRMGDLRQIIGDDASFAAEPSSALAPSRSQTLRKEWLKRNPNAPGQGTISREAGSYRGLFPHNEAPYNIEKILFEIMSPKITEQEIRQALDDPMFGGDISVTDAEINERVYGRRYANRRFGRTWKGAGSISRELIARQVVEGVYGPGAEALPPWSHQAAFELGQSVRNLPGGSPDVDPPLRGINRFRRGIGSLGQRLGDYFQMRERDPVSGSVLRWDPEGKLLKEVPESPLLPPPAYLTDVDPTSASRGIAGLGAKTNLAARRASATTLRAILNRLPAMVAAGAATAATSHPVSALADIALSPTELGSGDVPGDMTNYELRTSPITGLLERNVNRPDEETTRYYNELTRLGRELGVGQHRPSILQLSREMNGPSIRPSYPMRRMRR